jgi:hypothetical protein
MEYKSVKYCFELSKVIDRNNKYHLWITSFAIALQDLTIINNIIYNRLGNDIEHNMYFYKINIGHLREAFNLLRNAFKYEEIRDRLVQITGVEKMYNQILELNDGESKDSFGKSVLFELRNSIFHYIDDDKDFDTLKHVLDKLYRSNYTSSIQLYNNKDSEELKNYYRFGTEIQLNIIEHIGNNYKSPLEFEELLTKLTMLTAKVIRILEAIVLDFISNTDPSKFSYLVKTR